jgi:hypothetical protein
MKFFLSACAWVSCAVAAAMVLRGAFFLRGRRRTARNEMRGWRLRPVEPRRWAYEEKRGNAWVGIPFQELGRRQGPPFVVVAPSTVTWRTYPGWARQRRMEILGRVRSELSIRRYVIEGLEEAKPETGPALPPAARLSNYRGI